MIIIPVLRTNLDLITALNNNVTPLIEDQPTYFVLEAGEPATIIDQHDLDEMRKTKRVKTTVRKFYYC